MSTYTEQQIKKKKKIFRKTAISIFIERKKIFRKYIQRTQKCDNALTLSVFSTSASGVSINFLPLTIPALFISMVTSPISLLT